MKTRLLALVMALALVLGACGGGDDGGGGGGNAASGGVGEDNNCTSTDPVAPDIEPAAGVPQRGGSLLYGVEAETDGWDPANNRFALSGLMVSSAVFDTLTKPGLDGTYHPWLARSVEPNADATVWTVTVRDGITFHNGEPLTAEAVKLSLDAYRESALTSTALDNIEDTVVVDDETLEIRMAAPWWPFPMYLASQIGIVAAPATWTSDPSVRSLEPVGTGPYVFDEWVPDSHFRARANPDYWLDGADGEPLPYLDEIEFVPRPDTQSRQDSLRTGEVDIIHTFTPGTIEDFRQLSSDGELQAWESCFWGEDEEFLILLNNSKPPFDDPIAREAFAKAVDRDEILTEVFNNVFPVATGPWGPSSVWYSEPTEEQIEANSYDPEAAKELVQQYKDAHGGEFSFVLGSVIGITEARESMQLTQQYLQEAGIDVEIQEFEFAQYVSNGVFGDFEAQVWRQFGAPDPDGEYVWWYGGNAEPNGELSLNMARFDDPEIDAALDTARGSSSFEERKEQYDIVQDRFRDERYLLWSANAFWMVAANNDVKDVVYWELPDGTQGVPLSGGNHPVGQIWKDQG